MSGAGAEVLRLDSVSKVFTDRAGPLGLGRRRAGVRALADVSLALRAGETLAVVGESGSGKSTLARVAMRLLDPSAGRVLFKGRDVTRCGGAELRWLRRRMQIVFQDPYAALSPRMTVRRIVEEPLVVHRVGSARSRRQRAGELLELVGLRAADGDRYPHEFSGGQRQRVSIARALALGPEALVLDEPVSALDVSTQAQVVNLLRRLQRELGLAYLFVSHDLSVVHHVADRVLVLYLGRVMETGGRDEVFERHQHPYTRALLSAIPVSDPDERDRARRIVLQGDLPNPADPPSGCPFRTRCWKATERCASELPELAARPAPGTSGHPVACHHPEQRRDAS